MGGSAFYGSKTGRGYDGPEVFGKALGSLKLQDTKDTQNEQTAKDGRSEAGLAGMPIAG